jgi:hypothetical protein
MQNLILPYPLTVDSNGTYNFSTDSNVNYLCRFKNITPYLSPVIGIYDIKVFDFEFVNQTISPIGKRLKGNGYDNRISAAIIHLLNLFFQDPLSVIVYICDDLDNKHKERSILFKQWYNKGKDTFVRIPGEIDLGNKIIHGCILIRKDFPHTDILNQEFI